MKPYGMNEEKHNEETIHQVNLSNDSNDMYKMV